MGLFSILRLPCNAKFLRKEECKAIGLNHTVTMLSTEGLKTFVFAHALKLVPNHFNSRLGVRNLLSMAGAHHLERATYLFSCNGVFTSKVIFRLNFPLMRLPQEPDDQLQEIDLTS